MPETLKLLRLALENFKGVREFEIRPLGAPMSIYGDNGLGKTTLADAYVWLLTGKDLSGKSDSEIKTLAPDNTPVHNLNHAVEGEFETADGKLTLRRKYREKYERKRGSNLEFDGHTTDYYLNGVEVTEARYSERVARICPPGVLSMLIDPAHFCGRMKWEDRRSVLLDMCGDVSDADVIGNSKDLAGLPALMAPHSIADFRKVLATQREAINNELREVPARIDEANRSKSAVPPGLYREELIKNETKLKALSEKRSALRSGEQSEALRLTVMRIEGQKIDLVNAAKSAPNPERDKALKERSRLNAEMQEVSEAHSTLCRRLEMVRASAPRLEEALTRLRAEWEHRAADGFAGEDICAACGQALPEDKVQEAKERHNEVKARALAGIRAEGKRLKEELEKTLVDRSAAIEETEKLDVRFEDLKKALGALVIPEAQTFDATSTPEYQALLTGEAKARSELEQLQNSVAEAVAHVDAEISGVTSAVIEGRNALSRLELNASLDKRISVLEAREKELAGQFEENQRQLFLTEEFVRAKVSLLTDRINSRFSLVKWKLFREQVNGGLTECCTALVGGVPYSSTLNTAGRVNAGLDVLNALGAHYGIAPPVFVDNAESVGNLLATEAQQIRLVFSASDLELRAEGAAPEVSRKAKKAAQPDLAHASGF